MPRFVAHLRLALFLALAGFFGIVGTAQARDSYFNHNLDQVELTALPPQAQHTLHLIQHGGPFPFPRKDGNTFGNFERRLPSQSRGYYREYTVPTPGSHDRGARRIIAGEGHTGNVATSGEYYYTDDHYRSFRRIREQ